VAAVLVVVAYVIASPLVEAVALPFTRINLPLGLAAMFLGSFTIVVRREAVPQLLGFLCWRTACSSPESPSCRTCR
jgi:hydrogenase-4 component E